MYGTIALMKPKEGQIDALNALFEEWWTERRPEGEGRYLQYRLSQRQQPGRDHGRRGLRQQRELRGQR